LALLGRNVINRGTLNAPGGEVLMLAALDHQQVRLSSPNMILNLEVGDAPVSAGTGFTALDLPTLLTVGASALDTQPTLTIASDGTAAIVNGEINTLSEVGGQIAILGNRVTLLNARVEASGQRAGQIHIGGNYQGQGNLPNSLITLVDSLSEIRADNLGLGNGGRVILWGDNATTFAGRISARGGSQGGDGGFVEVSGKRSLSFSGTVDVTAPQGQPGTLLLDPTNIIITSLPGASGDGDLASQSGIITSDFLPSDGTDSLVLSESALESLLASANVSLAALNDITIEGFSDGFLGNFSGSIGSLTLNAGGTITMLNSADTIAIGGDIGITGGTLFLGDLNSSNGSVNLVSTIGVVAVGNISTPSGGVAIDSADQVQLNGTITSIDDILEPFNFPPEGFSNASGSISITTGVIIDPGTEGTPSDADSSSEGDGLVADNEEGEAGDTEDEGIDSEDQSFAGVDFGSDNFEVQAEFDAAAYEQTDASFDQEFSTALNLEETEIDGAPQTLESAQAALKNLQSVANVYPAIVYVNFTPSLVEATETGAIGDLERQPTDNLEIILVTSEGQPLRKVLRGVTRAQVEGVTNLFRQSVGTTDGLTSDRYLVPAARLYRWLIGTIEPELQAQGIDNILFSMPSGLRSLPLAALHDGQQFLVEKYSIGLTPSLRLTDLRYTSLQDAKLIALGSAEFTDQADLPAVPIEVNTITQQIWPGDAVLNEEFTLENLLNVRESGSYSIMHLATHADFEVDDLNQSYIQLWDSRLRFNQLRDLQFSEGPPLELLVLSACRTALGNDQAELGFAGLAVQAGVKTSLASLWYVSDEGTLGLMTEFYRQLRDPSVNTKSQALRQAQLAMIQGDITVASGELRGPSFRGGISLPNPTTDNLSSNLSHPYYWAAFTLVGNPW